jgi:cysteine desulfurase/selenocysteine lyase
MVAAATGAVVRPIPITEAGELDLSALAERLDERVRVVAIKHICNVLGTVNPVAEVARMAHAVGAVVVVDGAQALAHVPVDVTALDVDFYCGGSHKVYGPMGVGFVYGRRDLLEAMPPYQGGGDMIRTVAFDHVTFAEVPHKFEAGTPNVAGVVAFGAALDWFASLDREAAWAHEDELAREAAAEIVEIPGARLRGTAAGKAPVVSFTVDWAHPHDLGTVLDQHGVAVRTGHHCCMPLMTHFGIPGTVRASFAVYNTKQDKEVLIRALHRAREIFA